MLEAPTLRFTKMHGLGNDYVYLDGHSEDLTQYDLTELAKLVSDRHFGVGSDGLILVLPSEQADFRMRIFNPDGSEAEMCGNGIRAFAKYVYEHGLTQKADLIVHTGAGLIHPVLTVEAGRVVSVRVDMGEPRLARSEIPMAGEPAEIYVNQRLMARGEIVVVNDRFAVRLTEIISPQERVRQLGS
jgi:diaminopimelate epimerase